MTTNSVKDASKLAEKHYLTFLDNAPDIVFTVDLNGKFLYINKAAKRIIGIPVSKLLKSSLQAIAAPVYKDTIKKLFQNGFKGKSIPLLEIEVLGSNGKQIPLEIHIERVKDKNGKLIEFQGIARDISKRKKAMDEINHLYKEVEKAKTGLKSTLDNATNIAIQAYNINGEVVYWNRYSEKLFGYPEKNVKGKTLKGMIFSEKDERDYRKLLTNSIKNRKSSPKKEWAITTKKGERKQVLCHIFPAVFPGQESVAVAMHMDITENLKAREKIDDMLHQMESFSSISADILSIEDEEELFERISQAVVDISDYERVLISYFTDKPPYREIIGYRGITEAEFNRVQKVSMPKEKYMKYFERGIEVGSQSCYIPHKMKSILDKKAIIPGDKSYPAKEGRWHKEDNLLVAMRDTKGELIGIISVDDSKSGRIPTEETVRPLEIFANLISEIIQKHKLAKKISESEEKYRELVTNIKIGIFRATPEGKILEANPSVVEMFGYTNAAKFLNLNKTDLYNNPEDYNHFIDELEEKGIVKNEDYTLKREDGELFWASITSAAIKDKSGKIIYYDTVIEDITERKKLEEEVQRLSVTDELTGLYNRRYFNQNLPDEIKTAERWRSALSLIMIDIDDFKEYNDMYLHLEGDEVLKETAKVISDVIRKDMDWAARFGGDEFVIILPGINSTEASIVAERLRKFIHSIKFKPKSAIVHKTISLGVAHCIYSESRGARSSTRNYPTNYEKVATDLTILADKALFSAKNTGRNKVVISKKALEVSRISR
ncbi:MAG: PAS domain S-box protein [Candidatus Aminicenantes bacterium]|jgi:diguanylate cyclase (GGDEF)-like protein/PAS domain S-box-containing protein